MFWKITSAIFGVFVVVSAPAGKAAVLFDNLGVVPCCEGPIAAGTPYGDSFSTGSAAFDFNSLTVSLLNQGGAPYPDLTITALLLADSSSSPGAVLETIGVVDASTIPVGTHTLYTFSSPGYILSPDTRYWIELTSNDSRGASAQVEWDSTDTLAGTIGTSGEYWSANEGASTLVFPNGTNGGPLLMEVANVPEPSTWAMMLLGFAGLGFLGYRRSVRRGALATRRPGRLSVYRRPRDA